MLPFEYVAKRHIAKEVRSPELRQKLTPNYRIGCKRILMSNEYYPALQRENVTVVTGADGAIAEVTPKGIRTADGTEHEVDCIVWATGFQEAGALAPFPVRAGEKTLDQVWGINPEAYKGTGIHGFPNLFMLVGPNTGLGHSSMILMIEAQVRYLVQAMQWQDERGHAAIEPRADAQRHYNDRLQKRLNKTIWATGCNAWYTNSEGRNTTLWPGSTLEFDVMMRRFDDDAWQPAPGA